MLGQRAVTIVTYLDDQFEGGTTRFPRLSLEYRGEPGDAIMFFNLCADGLPDMNTLHEGSPVISGRKWVLSQWIRNRPHPSRCW
jgi:prolyl 4-hydroxylase